jgi:hypothetical protein
MILAAGDPTALTADYTVEILSAGKGSAKNQ